MSRTIVEEAVSRVCPFSERDPEVTLAMTVRLEIPGEPCVAIATALTFDYDPELAEGVQYALDDRLYSGIYAGLAAAEGPLPPEGLKITVSSLSSTPSLAHLLQHDRLSDQIIAGDYLEELAGAATERVWRQAAEPA